MTTRPQESRIGAYRLLTPLGEGGMGVVHLAQGPDGRRVALKVLRPHIVGDREARERLAREVSSLRRISSPRIAEIVDADPHGPVPFVVTRYVPGLSLHHHVAEEGPVTGRDLWHLAGALAEALAAVHAVGVLHRDVKPTNVLMEGRSPVLIDFGLARLADDPRLTQTGFLIGTPGYLAPEILYGDDATTASDVHAWAATVAFAATGQPPYGTGPVMAVMDRVRRGEHDLAGVPGPLADVLRPCLASDPGDRPTLPEVRERIARLAAGVGRPPVAPEPLTMPVAPRPRPSEPSTRVLPAAAPQPSRPAPGAPSFAAPQPSRRAVPDRVLPRLQVAALGAMAGALVALAPYAGMALDGLAVLALATASVTRERHGRRRRLRGGTRWYDVPTTTLSLPGYLLLALVGALGLVAVAALVATASFAVGYLLGQPLRTGLLLGGAGFALALWWGPGADRSRETTRWLAARAAHSGPAGWLVVGLGLAGTVVLVGTLLSRGPIWAPALRAPWR